jgi:hypothetical protein
MFRRLHAFISRFGADLPKKSFHQPLLQECAAKFGERDASGGCTHINTVREITADQFRIYVNNCFSLRVRIY